MVRVRLWQISSYRIAQFLDVLDTGLDFQRTDFAQKFASRFGATPRDQAPAFLTVEARTQDLIRFSGAQPFHRSILIELRRVQGLDPIQRTQRGKGGIDDLGSEGRDPGTAARWNPLRIQDCHAQGRLGSGKLRQPSENPGEWPEGR